MKNIILFLFAVLATQAIYSQHTFTAVITDADTNEVLIGATAMLKGTTQGAITDLDGKVILTNVPAGEQILVFSFLGYETEEKTFQFPLEDTAPVSIQLHSEGDELEEVIISSTRSSRSIDNIATRVESISGEELSEKGNMKPGEIRMLLSESTGIQTQQTSATSYNSSIRIQGLDGKYTQLLRDGLPLYGGFSGGLSIMQIAPLDLKRAEVIKGASSTLYGGGAIAGLVNLISRTPTEEQELNVMLNGTSALGLDASAFYGEKFNKKIGATVFASYNKGTPYDPADIGLTAIPEFDRFTLTPRLFFYLQEETELNVGASFITEDRLGGNIDFIKGDNVPNAYFEENKTDRFSTQLGFTHQFNEQSGMEVKNSISHYDRSIEIPDFTFAGHQLSSFSEINYHYTTEKSEWIAGANLWTDTFTQDQTENMAVVDYNYTTVGGFVQNTWNATSQFILETGFRGDYQNEYGFFALPRISGLYKINPKLAVRLGGGLGYKTPNIFTEDAERIQFRNVLPIDVSATKAERSIGGNLDFNYKTPLAEDLFLSVNTLFFYTKIEDPLILFPTGLNFFEFQQPDGYIDTKGIETNIKLKYKDFKLFVGYTLADVNEHYNGETTEFPLVAQHRLNNVLMYEKHDNFWIGLEGYYFSPQKLNDGQTGQSYWIVGVMTEKKITDRLSLFLNFENFLDTRQTRFDTIYTGSLNDPNFRDIYAPVDGFVVNGGIKLELGG